MYMAYHIFLVLPIKDLINKDRNMTTPYKLAMGMKPSIPNLCVLFCPFVVPKATAYVGTKTLNMHLPRAKGFLQYVCWNSRELNRVPCLCTTQTEDRIFIRFFNMKVSKVWWCTCHNNMHQLRL